MKSNLKNWLKNWEKINPCVYKKDGFTLELWRGYDNQRYWCIETPDTLCEQSITITLGKSLTDSDIAFIDSFIEIWLKYNSNKQEPAQTPPPVMTTDEARDYYAPALQQEEVAPSPKFERIVNNINDIIQRDFRKYECAILDAKLSIGQQPNLTVIIGIEVGSSTDTHTILSAWHNNSIVWMLNSFFMVTEVQFKPNKEQGFGRLAEVTLYTNTGAKRLSDARMAAQEIERQTRSTNSAVIRMPYDDGAPGGISNTQGAV